MNLIYFRNMHICTFIIVSCLYGVICENHAEDDHEHGEHEHVVDPFDEIKEMYNITTNVIGVEDLQTVLDGFSAKIHCEGGDANDHCQSTVCFNATQIAVAFNSQSTGFTEDVFGDVTLVLLHALSNVTATCGGLFDFSYSELTNFRSSLSDAFCDCESNSPTATLKVDAIQTFLERLPLEHDDEDAGHSDEEGDHHEEHGHEEEGHEEHGHEEEGHDEHDHEEEGHDGHVHEEDGHDEHGHEEEGHEEHGHEEEGHDEHGHEEEGHEEHGHEEEGHDEHVHEEDGHEEHGHEEEGHEEHGHEEEILIKDKCVSAGILYDGLGLDLHGDINVSETGHLASLIVLHILKGSHVSKQCRLLPRGDYFIENVFHRHGTENETITKQGFTDILKLLNIGGHAQDTHTDEHTDEHDGHDDHKRKRRDTGDTHQDDPWGSTCLTADQYFAVFDVDSEITQGKFSELCPALIQQKINGPCGMADMHDDHKKDEPTNAEKYGFGTLCGIIICLCSVFAVLFIRCQNTTFYLHFMDLFIGLAVGTLFTDALFHLIPMAFGIHSDEHHDHSGEGITVEPYLWHALSTCAGLYVFYLIEKSMSMFVPQRGHSHNHSHSNPALTYGTSETTLYGKSNEAIKPKDTASLGDVDVSVDMGQGSQEKIVGNSLNGISSVVIMVIIGDAIHNFADGLALGAAFSTSNSLGFSTAIAVFCHELPHELGDFVVLLNGGLTFCKALMWNLISSLTAMIGLYMGLAVSTDESVRQWIVGVTAGMFLYIALVDLLPQLLKRKANSMMTSFILNNIGILVGAVIMLLLAIFEEKIKVG